MRSVSFTVTAFLLLALASSAYAAPRMRPYSGIGVVKISAIGLIAPIPYYDEPGMLRNGSISADNIRDLTAWLFDSGDDLLLLVTARKNDWLKIERDDAGREAWILPERRWVFTPWEQFLKGSQIAFLRNSPKKLMQVVAQPGSSSGAPLPVDRSFKVILAQGDWAYVLIDHTSAGWIRWRDADGRLLVGIRSTAAAK